VNGARAVATYESLGLYWTPATTPSAEGCSVIFRRVGDATFRQGLNLWYDARNNECRGSLVLLDPGTSYEVQIGLAGQSPVAGVTAATWQETDQLPVAQTITLPAGTRSTPLAITQGGSASGYIVYQADPASGTTIDVQNQSLNNVTIAASFVILRGFTLKGAQADAINLLAGAHDLVIEKNDISGWGRYRTTGSWDYGMDYDAGVRCESVSTLERVTVQRNKIHDPRYGANSWDSAHPAGPQGMSFNFCGGKQRDPLQRSDERPTSTTTSTTASAAPTTSPPPASPTTTATSTATSCRARWTTASRSRAPIATCASGTTSSRRPAPASRARSTRWARSISSATSTTSAACITSRASTATIAVRSSSRARRIRPSATAAATCSTNTSLQARDPSAANGLGASGGVQGTGSAPMTDHRLAQQHLLDLEALVYVGGSSAAAGTTTTSTTISTTAASWPTPARKRTASRSPRPRSPRGNGAGMSGMYQLQPGTPGYGMGVRIANFNDQFAAPDNRRAPVRHVAEELRRQRHPLVEEERSLRRPSHGRFAMADGNWRTDGVVIHPRRHHRHRGTDALPRQP